jgi:hypothetical protein
VSNEGDAMRLRGARRNARGALVLAMVAALMLVFAASAYAGSCECVRSVEPNSGPKAGGSTVTIKVQAFGEVTALKFGSKPATISKVESEGVNQTITAISPPGEGTVDVIATLAGGRPQSTAPACTTGPGENCDQFTYLPTGSPGECTTVEECDGFFAPSVAGVQPDFGPSGGGTSVTITGREFDGATAVSFGSTPAKSFTVLSRTSITAISPPGTGVVDVTVTTPNGTRGVDRFDYEPTVIQVEPDFGPVRGGTAVRISGISLSGATAVMFGSTHAATFTVRSDSSIIAHAPPGTGTVNITVTTPGGTSATGLGDLFSYATPGDGTILPTPSLGSEGSLDGASCVSPRFCVAVGHDGVQGAEGLIEVWNGQGWAVAAAPPTAKSTLGGAFPVTITAQYNGVSCSSPTFCAAVGTERALDPFSPDSSGPGVLLANWNGAMWLFPPDTGLFPGELSHVNGLGRRELNGVSCVSSSFCVAVGAHGFSGLANAPSLPLVESWNGETWSPVPSPEPARGVNSPFKLQGVSCTSTDLCVAVGTGGLIESWNGTAWSIVPSPNSGTLNGVWCASAKRCLAVGANEGAALIESWDGSTWSTLESPKPQASALESVTCVLKTRCVAVGGYTVGGAARTLLESLDRGKWLMDGVSDSTALNGVSCTATGSCFAVGYDEAGPAGPSQTLVLVGSV